MLEKFKVLLFLFLFVSFLHCEENRKISVIKKINENVSLSKENYINYLIDSAEVNIKEKYQNISIVLDTENFENLTYKQISNNIFQKNEDAFFFIDASADQEIIKINIKFYTYLAEMINEEIFVINEKDNIDEIKQEQLDQWNEIFNKSISKLFTKMFSNKINNKLIEPKNKFIHDFPYINISINFVSLKLYFDNRTIAKMFSFFPIDMKFSFYPLKYMDLGTFIRFNVNDMVYKYFDINQQKSYNYDSKFDFSYGIFIEFSYFGETFHYSLGIQFYNIFYDVSSENNFTKTNDFYSYFLPQISVYQKLDIKIFKMFYYSLFFSLKTMPNFFFDGKYLFSKSFSYDFVNLEFSFLGFSIIF